MAGSPKRRARRLALLATQRQEATGEPLLDAARAVEVETGRELPTVPQATQLGRTPVPGEMARVQLEDARREMRTAQGEWLIGPVEEILEGKREQVSITAEMEDAFIDLIRAGVPIKDSLFGPGAARMVGSTPSGMWYRVCNIPEFAKRYREARDLSSEVLEDEMRAMLPAAMGRPELLDSLEFVAGRLEWLAKVRNRERYDNKKPDTMASGITINVNSRPPTAVEKDVTPKQRVIDVEPTKTIKLKV